MSDGTRSARWVIERNVARFRAMLDRDIAADRRHEIERLLAEELGKLAVIDGRRQHEE
jgi:hypothetical protein